MDLLRAAFLLESEISELQNLPAWKRRGLENIVHASVRAMREAAERLEQLESLQQARSAGTRRSLGDEDVNLPLTGRGR